MINEPVIPIVATGVLSALLGPILGPYALIAFGAVVGSLLAMSRTPTVSRMDGLKFIAIGVLVALAITGAAVWAVEKYLGIPGNIALLPLSFVIGASRNSILGLMDKAFDALADILKSRKEKP